MNNNNNSSFFDKAKFLKLLRTKTQAGFMDCQKALTYALNAVDKAKTNFDEIIKVAVKWLRENGIAKAASKNVDKIATEGLTLGGCDENGVALLELNSETDFTGKSEPITKLAKEILVRVLESKTDDLEKILKLKLVNWGSVKEACLALSATTGEKVVLRRVVYLPLAKTQSVGLYVHNNNKISAFVVFENHGDEQKLKGVAMHLAAMNPKFLSQADVDQTWLNNERSILEAQLAQENKPKEFATKIIDGRIKKLLSEVSLLSQQYIVDPSKTVGEFIESLNVKPLAMCRYELGEGIEKKEVDFVKEVAAQMK